MTRIESDANQVPTALLLFLKHSVAYVMRGAVAVLRAVVEMSRYFVHHAKPTNPGELWTAVSAVLTAFALYFAARAALSVGSTLRMERRPVLTLEHRHGDDTVHVRNVGRGLALTVFVTDEDGNLVQTASAIGAEQSVRIGTSGIEFSLMTGNYIYGEDTAGQWVRTFATYRGLKRSEHNQFNNRVDGYVWRAPRRALRELERTHRSVMQHVHALESFLTVESWSHRAEQVGTKWRIGFGRWWHGLGENHRLQQFSGRAEKYDKYLPIEAREGWDIDVSGVAPCWKGERLVEQLGCDWEDDMLVCEVRIRGALKNVRGLLVIERTAFAALPDDRDARNEIVRDKFLKYICGLRPQERFVFLLRPVIGSWLVNDVL